VAVTVSLAEDGMTCDDRYSRYGDRRLDDYWHQRYRRIDAEYAAAEAVRRTELDRWGLDVRRGVERDWTSRARPAGRGTSKTETARAVSEVAPHCQR